MSKHGISIDPKRVSVIIYLPLPAHKKALQIFLGRINFLRRFYSKYRYSFEGKRSFEEIKKAIKSTPTLINHDYPKDFILYVFGSVETIPTMLVQQNQEGLEQPTAFFSQVLKDCELSYSFVEKHVLSIIRSLKNFRHMLSNNKIHLLVAHPSIKEFLLRKELNEKRVDWITKVMEYDVDIKVTKLIRGKGLCGQLVRDVENNKEYENQVVLVHRDEEEPTVATPSTS